MSYASWFHKWHAIAYDSRYRTRGKKYASSSSYWVQRHPTDPTAFQIYQRIWLSNSLSNNKYQRVPPQARGRLIVVTARANELILDNQPAFKRVTIDVPPEYKAQYPNAAREFGPYVHADTTFNNLLHTIGPGFYHVGNKSSYKPGFNWHIGDYYPCTAPVLLAGPVRYDTQTGLLSAVNPQPNNETQELARKHINASIRQAFKRLKVLTTMGVAVTTDELLQVRQRMPVGELYSPQGFVDFANIFDPQTHAQTIELCARANALARTYGVHPLATEAGLATLRRTLQRKLLKVTNPV